MSLQIDVMNAKGEKIETLDLAAAIFEAKGSKSVVHEVVNAVLANKRRGTHSTKTRGEVSGGGVKPWKQKGTGNARSGSNRSPLWRHGGIIFGPKPRSYFQGIPLAKRQQALRLVLTDYVKAGKLTVIDSVPLTETKTKFFSEWTAQLKLPNRSIVVVEEMTENLDRATRNLEGVRFCRAKDLNSASAMLAHQLVVTKGALAQLITRLQGDIRPQGDLRPRGEK